MADLNKEIRNNPFATPTMQPNPLMPPMMPPMPPPPADPNQGFQQWASDQRNAMKVQPAMTSPSSPLQPNAPGPMSAIYNPPGAPKPPLPTQEQDQAANPGAYGKPVMGTKVGAGLTIAASTLAGAAGGMKGNPGAGLEYAMKVKAADDQIGQDNTDTYNKRIVQPSKDALAQEATRATINHTNALTADLQNKPDPKQTIEEKAYQYAVAQGKNPMDALSAVYGAKDQKSGSLEQQYIDALASGDKTRAALIKQAHDDMQKEPAAKSTKEQLQAQIADADAKGDKATVAALQKRLKAIDPEGQQRMQISINGQQMAHEDRANNFSRKDITEHDKAYVQPAEGVEKSYQMMDNAYREYQAAKAQGKQLPTGAQSMLALSTHLSTTFGNVKGARITKDMIQEHLGARGVSDDATTAVQRLTNGDALSPAQWDAFHDLVGQSRKMSWQTAVKEAQRKSIPVDFLPRDLGNLQNDTYNAPAANAPHPFTPPTQGGGAVEEYVRDPKTGKLVKK